VNVECFVEQGDTYNECISRISAKYGGRFIELSRKKVRLKGGFLGLFPHEGMEVTFYIPSYFNKSNTTGPVPVYNEGDPHYGSAVRKPQVHDTIDFEEQKRRVISAAGKDPDLSKLISEVRNLSEKFDANTAEKRVEEHPSINRIGELLKENDFSQTYIEKMKDRIRRELPLETLEDSEKLEETIVEWIGETIQISGEPRVISKPRIMVLVGPTGVGKTTTIAKLAAIFGLGANTDKPPQEVRMITIDAFRIGARAQIEAYGKIMGFPVSYVDNHADLKKAIALYSEDVDLILVDTIGKSPKDAAKLGEMKELLAACGSRAEIHLAVSATTKTSDIEEMLAQFEPFNYRSVIVTKLDETSHVGNIISALWERGKSFSYITNGQKVPNDIEKANVVRLLINLDGFEVKRDKIEERFPVETSEIIQWR
jgi:flagellar biosynthesis protein FlhF